MRTVSAQSVSSPLMDLIGAVAIALLLKLGHIAINHHQMQPGQFLALIVALFKLYDPIRLFAVYWNSFQQAVGSSQAIFDFIDDEEHVVEKPSAVTLSEFHQAITLDHVGFGFVPRHPGQRAAQVLRTQLAGSAGAVRERREARWGIHRRNGTGPPAGPAPPDPLALTVPDPLVRSSARPPDGGAAQVALV